MTAIKQLSAFISYDRNNKYLAIQLGKDLGRAGIEFFLDKNDIKADDSDWKNSILQNIESKDCFIYLASPEAEKSKNVKNELEAAELASKSIIVLHIAGKLEDLGDNLCKRQITDWSAVSDKYPELLKKLIVDLHGCSSEYSGLSSLLHCDDITVADAALRLGDEKRLNLSGQTFSHLPITASAYTMSYLIAPTKTQLILPEQPAMLLRCSGKCSRNTLSAVLKHRLDSDLQPWVFYLEGHVPKESSDQFELPVYAPHIWKDTLDAAMALLHKHEFKCRKLDIYLDCPAILALELGNRLKGMIQFECYQYDFEHSYHKVFGNIR